MKKLLFVLIVVSFVIPSVAQNAHIDYKYAIKGYNTGSYQYERTSQQFFYYSKITKTTNIRFFDPTIAFQKKTKRNNFHEIEFTDLQLFNENKKTVSIIDSSNSSKLVDGYNITSSGGAMKYEFIIPFAKKKDRRLVPSIGLGINQYFNYQKFSPIISSVFPSSERTFGFSLYAAHRLTYYFSKRFFIDLNIPLFIDVAEYKIIKIDNPVIAVEDRKNVYRQILENDPYFQVRLGLGIKL